MNLESNTRAQGNTPRFPWGPPRHAMGQAQIDTKEAPTSIAADRNIILQQYPSRHGVAQVTIRIFSIPTARQRRCIAMGSFSCPPTVMTWLHLHGLCPHRV